VERKCAAGSGEIEEGNSAKSADMRRVTDCIAASILEELGGTTLLKRLAIFLSPAGM
jgi:hypothetical protein